MFEGVSGASKGSQKSFGDFRGSQGISERSQQALEYIKGISGALRGIHMI